MTDVMRFLPQGEDDLRRMLETVGVSAVSELFASIPARLRLPSPPDLPPRQSEMELRRTMGSMASRNATPATHAWFLGAGAYNHYVPAAVGQLLLRSEFYTSYTPYQPEISQGTLQAIFEYQSLMASLTELDVSNASLYDGASAAAEGVLLAHRATRKKRVLLADGLHPNYRRVVKTYVQHLGLEIVPIPVGADGRTDLDALARLRDGDTAIVVLQSPNIFGCIEDVKQAVGIARQVGALVQVVVTEALSMGLLHGPGHWGADIAAGEGQSLGCPLQFGGPYLGFMVAREALTRQMPGRLVGATVDVDGRQAYVLTLVTREQHIRREKATSNICTNQGLLALAATIQMCLLGKAGMREVAEQNHSKAVWARDLLAKIEGCRPRFSAPIFNEFVLDMPADASDVSDGLLARGIVGGLPLAVIDETMSRSMLFCVTEMNTREEIEKLAASLQEILA